MHSTAAETLRYLDGDQANIAGERCDAMTIRAATGRALGRLQGFIIDPLERQLRYFVVRTSGLFGASRLIPVTAARVNVQDRAIELLADEDDVTPIPHNPQFPAFSDEDFLNAIFARRN